MDYSKKRNRLLKLMDDCGIAKAIVGDPINIYYFTGIELSPYERFIALIQDLKTGDCSLVLPNLERGKASARGITEILYADEEDPFVKLKHTLNNCKTIGIETNYFTMAVAEKIKTVCISKEINWVYIDALIGDLRKIKDAEEIENILTAARHGDQTLEEVSKKIRVGQTENEIVFELFKGIINRTGISLERFIAQVLSGSNSAYAHGVPGDRKIKTGDPLTIDFCLNYSHYWSDFTRTFFLGKPKEQLQDIYGVVLEAQQKAIAEIRPGITIGEVDLAARQVIEKAGYGESFTHRTGHGIGLSIHELPSVHGRNGEILEEGMVFTVEPGIYIPQLGGVRIEDDVVVTKQGGVVLNGYPKEYEAMILGD